MPEFYSDERDARGHVLPEAGARQLRMLQAHLVLWSRLAARRTDGAVEHTSDARVLAEALALLAGQLQEVLETMSGPLRIGADDAHMHVGQRGAVDADRDGDNAASARAGRACAVTLDRLDGIDRRVALIAAQGDLLMASAAGDLTDGTLYVIAASICDNASVVRDLLRGCDSTHADTRGDAHVSEMPARYCVVRACPSGLLEARRGRWRSGRSGPRVSHGSRVPRP